MPDDLLHPKYSQQVTQDPPPADRPVIADPPRCPDCLDHQKITTCGVLNLVHSNLFDPDFGSDAEELFSAELFEDSDLLGMAHVMRESPHASHALIPSVTWANVPQPCSITCKDWEPYYAEDPDLKVLLDWGITKNIEYGIYRWHEAQWGHQNVSVDGRAVVSVAILSNVMEALRYVAHQGTPETLELFKRQFHVRNLSDDDLRDSVKEVVDACVLCAQSKSRRGPHPESCDLAPVPSYPFA